MSPPIAVPLGLSAEDEQSWRCHMQLARQAQTPWVFAGVLLALILVAVAILALGRPNRPLEAAEAVVPIDPATLESQNHSAELPPIR